MVKRITSLATITAFVTATGAPAYAQPRPAAGGARPAAATPSAARPAAGRAGGRRGTGTAATAPAATPPAAPVEDASTVEARTEYNAGRTALAAGDAAGALPHFQRAYELRSNPVVLLPIAQAHETLGHIGDAIATLERYLRERADAPDREAIQARLTALRARPATIHVATTPPGGRILIDGTDTGHVTPADVTAPPGHHVVRVERDGYGGHTQEVDATPGGRVEVTTELAALPSAEPAPTPVAALTPAPAAAPESGGSSVAVWAGAAIAAGGIIAGSVFGFMALNDLSTYNMTPSTMLRDTGESHALLSDIFFGVAVLSASVAIVVYLSEGSPQTGAVAALNRTPRRPRAQFHLAPTGFVLNF